jgi:hypothetical protein
MASDLEALNLGAEKNQEFKLKAHHHSPGAGFSRNLSRADRI